MWLVPIVYAPEILPPWLRTLMAFHPYAPFLAGLRAPLVDHGVEGFTLDRLVHEYRATCAGGLVMSIGAAMLVSRTERGDDMFVTSVARYAQQVLDLDALSG